MHVDLFVFWGHNTAGAVVVLTAIIVIDWWPIGCVEVYVFHNAHLNRQQLVLNELIAEGPWVSVD